MVNVQHLELYNKVKEDYKNLIKNITGDKVVEIDAANIKKMLDVEHHKGELSKTKIPYYIVSINKLINNLNYNNTRLNYNLILNTLNNIKDNMLRYVKLCLNSNYSIDNNTLRAIIIATAEDIRRNVIRYCNNSKTHYIPNGIKYFNTVVYLINAINSITYNYKQHIDKDVVKVLTSDTIGNSNNTYLVKEYSYYILLLKEVVDTLRLGITLYFYTINNITSSNLNRDLDVIKTMHKSYKEDAYINRMYNWFMDNNLYISSYANTVNNNIDIKDTITLVSSM